MTPPPRRNSGRAKGRYKPAGDRHPGKSKNRPMEHGSRPRFRNEMRRIPKGPSSKFRTEKRPDEISPSRLGAARALYSLEKGSKVSDVLVSNRNLKPEDEALLRELVYGCTRQKRLLDHYLNSLCQSPFEKLPIEVKISLRLGLYQLLFLDRVPAHAAVHESVNLAKKGGQEKLSGFVNAVLRNAETRKGSLEVKGDSEVDTLSLRYSHPTWLTKKWTKEYGENRTEEILKANNRPHPVYLHVKPGLGDKVAEDLGRQGTRVTKEPWPNGTLRLRSHEGGLFSGESFQQGDWIVQDWAPQVMLELLPLAEGQRAWDVCAAPGGKTVALAWKLGDKGQVMASDASEDRRKKLAENLKRTGLKQVQVYDGDIKKIVPSQKFDLAWVDAPCSGTGVLSRRADLRWRLIPKDVSSNVETQQGLLDEAQGHLYSKGYLVYSTCSLEREENQEIIESFLKSHPEWKAFIPEVSSDHSEILKDDLGLTFLPTEEHDGGFLAVLTRNTT